MRLRTSKQAVLYGNEDFIKTHTRKEIMEKFNVDYNTVENFCYKNGIKPVPNRTHKFEVPAGFAEYAKTHTVTQTGHHFNLGYATVLRMCKENGITCKKVQLKIEQFDYTVNHRLKRSGLAHEMIRELGKTFTNASIARVFGYSEERVRQICKEN